MSRDCKIGLVIAGGSEIDLLERDFHLLESPAMTVPPVRDYDKQEYPESAEAEFDPRTTLKPFEYKVSLGYFGAEEVANAKVRELFDSMFTTEPNSDIMIALPVVLKNYWKGVQMEGYVKQWDGKTYSLQGEDALVLFDLVLYVNNPRTFVSL